MILSINTIRGARKPNGSSLLIWAAGQVGIIGKNVNPLYINHSWAFQGQATVELTAFKEVVGVDPSDSMVTKATNLVKTSPPPNIITYVKNKAEELDFISTGSVDLVIAGIILP
jgi:hypothetical protein